MSEWKCDSNCGLCCKSVGDIKELESTNGICNNYNEELKQCNIYEDRPLVCRVIDGYDMYNNGLTMDEYIEVNMMYCAKLKENNR